MSGLRGRLGAVMDQDAGRFSGEEFAAERFGAVAGSVKRRRIVRSAGVGGASVVGASALAAGVINVPWGALGSGTVPGATPSVICTTTTPDAVPAGLADVPPGATAAVVDVATATAYFVGLVNGDITVWNGDGTEVPIEAKDGPVDLLLPSGVVVALEKDSSDAGFSITPADADAVDILGAHEYAMSTADTGTLSVTEFTSELKVEGERFWAVNVNGDAVATAHLEGDVLVVEGLEGTEQRVAVSDDGGYHFTVDGEEVVLSLAELDGEQIAVIVKFGDQGAGQETPEPVVDCVTPEPAVSESPSASPEPSVTPSSIASVTSAFQCGFDFEAYEFEAGDVIIEAGPVTQAQVREKFLAFYGEQAPTTEVPDSDAPAWHAMLNPEVDMPDASLFRFVAVRDGVVVGTIDSMGNTAPGYIADRFGDSLTEAYLWDRGAFTACGTASIDDAEIYAVAALDNGSGVDFAWNPVTP